jgi:hypothetical protein
MKRMVSKPSTNIRKPVKKGSLKRSEALVEEKNQPNATKEGTTTQASKKIDNEEAYQISSNVATPVCEKGNPDSTLNVDVLISDNKLGSEDLSTVMKHSENIDVDDSGNEIRVDDSVESDPEKIDIQRDVELDVETSLG